MGVFKTKDGSATKFTKAFASKSGKPSTFSKVLNTVLTAIDFIPVAGEASMAVQAGALTATKVATKTAAKIAVKDAIKLAAKDAVTTASKKILSKGTLTTVASMASSSASSSALQIRNNKLAMDQKNDLEKSSMGDASDSGADVVKKDNKVMYVLAVIAAVFGFYKLSR